MGRILKALLLMFLLSGTAFSQGQLWKEVEGLFLRQGIDRIFLQEGNLFISSGDALYVYKKGDLKRCFRIRGDSPQIFDVESYSGDIYFATQYGFFKGRCGGRANRIFKPKGRAVFAIERVGDKFFLGTQDAVFSFNAAKRLVDKMLETKDSVISMKLIDSKNMLFVLTETMLYCVDTRTDHLLLKQQLSTRREEAEIYRGEFFGVIGSELFFGHRDVIYRLNLNSLSLDKAVNLSRDIMALISFKDNLILISGNKVYFYNVELEKLTDRQSGLNGIGDNLSIASDSNRVLLSSGGRVYALAYMSKLPGRDSSIDIIYEYLSYEPDILLLQRKAMEYADVLPDKIESWKSALAKRPLMPAVSVELGGDNNKSLSDSMSVCCSGSYAVGPDDKTITKNLDWQIKMEWDLADLIWDPDFTAIDTRSKLTAELRDDILDDLDQLYYERRRLQIKLLTKRVKKLEDVLSIIVKLEKLRSDIDGMTGGFLTEYLKSNGHYDWEKEVVKRRIDETETERTTK